MITCYLLGYEADSHVLASDRSFGLTKLFFFAWVDIPPSNSDYDGEG